MKEISIIFDFRSSGKVMFAIDGKYTDRLLIALPSESGWVGGKFMKHCDRIVKVLKRHGNVDSKYIDK